MGMPSPLHVTLHRDHARVNIRGFSSPLLSNQLHIFLTFVGSHDFCPFVLHLFSCLFGNSQFSSPLLSNQLHIFLTFVGPHDFCPFVVHLFFYFFVGSQYFSPLLSNKVNMGPHDFVPLLYIYFLASLWTHSFFYHFYEMNYTFFFPL